MDAFLAYARQRQKEVIALIREFVECESPSDDAVGVNRMVDLIAESVKDVARVRTYPAGTFGRHMRCEFQLPGRRRTGRILALGHSDTVWALGTLRTMPFRESKGRLSGPG